MSGNILGGIAFARVSKYLRPTRTSAPSEVSSTHTIYEKLGISQQTGVVAYKAACLVVIAMAILFRPKNPSLLHSTIGGLLSGAAQAASILLTGSPVGESTAYEAVGQYFLRGLRTIQGIDLKHEAAPSARSIVFAAEILAGSSVLFSFVPSLAIKFYYQVSDLRAIAGGFTMTFKARMAGGCTSGHGISGMSLLSVSSIVTVASMFSGGIGLAMLLK